MNSIYDKTTSRHDKINNIGFDYEGNIFKRTMSGYLFQDEERAEILSRFEEIVFFLIEKVKLIKTFYNYTVSKNYRKLN